MNRRKNNKNSDNNLITLNYILKISKIIYIINFTQNI